MIKHLPLTILFLLFFITANAQTHADSVNNHPATDSIVKRPAADTASKFPSADMVKKALFDSLKKTRQPIDTVKPSPPKAESKPLKTDTSSKHLVHPKIVKRGPGPLVIPHSPVKTLSSEKYNALLKGGDFDDMALAAVLNHYPLPDSALKYKAQLGLNPEQLAKLKDVSSTLHRKKVEMGGNIIHNEKMLDSLFKIKQADDGTIIFYTNRYGLYLGEIRNAVLQACYKTENILSDDQIKKLERLEKL